MSTKFKFRLESVSKVRRIEMEQQAKVLALVFKEIAEAKQEIESLKQAERDEIKRVQSLADQGEFRQQMMLSSLSYREGLKVSIKKKRHELAQLQLRADEEQAKLLEKEKKKKILDKYEEKERERHETEVKASERKEMDEIASVLRSFSRK